APIIEPHRATEISVGTELKRNARTQRHAAGYGEAGRHLIPIAPKERSRNACRSHDDTGVCKNCTDLPNTHGILRRLHGFTITFECAGHIAGPEKSQYGNLALL